MIKLTINQVKASCISLGYTCLSDVFLKASVKLDLVCPAGHNVQLTYNKLQQGRRCKYCNNTYTQNEIDIILKNIGYTSIDLFETTKKKMRMICNNGHNITMDMSNILFGHKCKMCSIDDSKLSKDYLAEFCDNVGLAFIRSDYSPKLKVQVKCSYGHITTRLFSKLKRNPICLECHPISTEEHLTRMIVEDMFQIKFPSVFPNFLIWKNGYKMQLDMMNDELKLAFEYQGNQHYSYSSKFYKDESQFLDRIERDKFKLIRCKEVGVVLIQIPTLHRKIKIKDVPKYITSELLAQHFVFPTNYSDVIDVERIYKRYNVDK